MSADRRPSFQADFDFSKVTGRFGSGHGRAPAAMASPPRTHSPGTASTLPQLGSPHPPFTPVLRKENPALFSPDRPGSNGNGNGSDSAGLNRGRFDRNPGSRHLLLGDGTESASSSLLLRRGLPPVASPSDVSDGSHGLFTSAAAMPSANSSPSVDSRGTSRQFPLHSSGGVLPDVDQQSDFSPEGDDGEHGDAEDDDISGIVEDDGEEEEDGEGRIQDRRDGIADREDREDRGDEEEDASRSIYDQRLENDDTNDENVDNEDGDDDDDGDNDHQESVVDRILQRTADQAEDEDVDWLALDADALSKIMDEVKGSIMILDFEIKKYRSETSKLQRQFSSIQAASKAELFKMLKKPRTTTLTALRSRGGGAVPRFDAQPQAQQQQQQQRNLEYSHSTATAAIAGSPLPVGAAADGEQAKYIIEKLQERNQELTKAYRSALEEVAIGMKINDLVLEYGRQFKEAERKSAIMKEKLSRLEMLLGRFASLKNATVAQEEDAVRVRREMQALAAENQRLRAQLQELSVVVSEPSFRNGSFVMKQNSRQVESLEKRCQDQAALIKQLRASLQEKQLVVQKQLQDLKLWQRKYRTTRLEYDQVAEEKQKLVVTLLSAQGRAETVEADANKKRQLAETHIRRADEDRLRHEDEWMRFRSAVLQCHDQCLAIVLKQQQQMAQFSNGLDSVCGLTLLEKSALSHYEQGKLDAFSRTLADLLGAASESYLAIQEQLRTMKKDCGLQSRPSSSVVYRGRGSSAGPAARPNSSLPVV